MPEQQTLAEARADYRHIDVQPLTTAIGAEIGGVDLSQPLSADVTAEIRTALLEHLVVFFRDQDLTSAQFMHLASRFGEPAEYPFVKGLDGYPFIIPVVKLEHERDNFGGIWHSDTVYQAEPPMGTMLYALELPPVGGDTLFANQYLAYETLSDGMKALLDGLVAVNTSDKADVARTRAGAIKARGTESVGRALAGEHPAVRTHPETGRKALFVNTAHTVAFKGMTPAESAPILDYLFQHQIKPEFCCRFRWQPGSVAFWDNRCAQHNPVNDYHGYRRVLHRITLAGDRPV